MSRTVNSSSLPSVMQGKLRSIRRRLALLAVTRAVAVGASVLIAAMLVAMLADWWLVLFSTAARTTLTVASLLLAAAAVLVTGVRPLVAVLRWQRAAADADDEVPQLEERWTTVATFAASGKQPTSPTAQAMLQQVTSEAAAMGRLVQPRRVARPAALRPAALTFAACALLLTGFLAFDWPRTSVLLQRFFSPTADITATRIDSVTGDAEVPRGESLELVTELSGLPRDSARLTVRHESGIVDAFELKSDADRPHAFVHSLQVDDSFRYRVQAGDDRTGWHTVTAVDYPALSEVRFTVTAPEYVGRPPYEKSMIPSRVRAVQGSRLALAMKPATELERLELALSFDRDEEDPVEKVLTLAPDADGWYRFEAQLLEDMALRPTLVNAHGLTNEDRHACRIQVVPDKAPIARITRPTGETAAATDDVIDVGFEAHDDHGIATAELVVYDESKTEEGEEPEVLSVQEIPLGDQRLEKHVKAETRLDLKKLNLEEGATISYAVRVTDNRRVRVDRNTMLAQRDEARPGDPNDESPMRSAAQPNDDREDRTVARRDPEERSDRRPDNLGNLLADAGDAAGQRRPEGEPTADETGESRQSSQEARSESRSGTDEENQGTSNGSQPVDDDKSSRDGSDSSSRNATVSDKRDAAVAMKKDAAKSSSQDGSRSGHPDSDAVDRGSSQNDPNKERTSDNAKPAAGDPSGGKEALPKEENPTDRDGNSKDKGTAVVTDEPKRDDEKSAGPNGNPAAANEKSVANNDENRDTNQGRPGDDGNETKPAGDRDGDPEDNEQTIAKTDNEQNAVAGNSEKTDAERPGGKRTVQSNSSNRNASNRNNPSKNAPPPSEPIAMNPQQSSSGQNAETNRRTLKITQRLTAVADADERRGENMQIRDRVVAIDERLAEVETGLRRVVERQIPDADRGRQFRILDERLGGVETSIAELRKETRETEFAFVGLQMVDIGRTHVTPARDGIVVAIRDSSAADANSTEALQHVVRARELLAALLRRYDRVVRERELGKSLEETVKMYEVYVEKMHQLMRQRRQNTNPLQRKMGVITVDQAYLDRYAEVLRLRREMVSEFARMLGDDPRLLARYLDLLKRRRESLRDRLSKLAGRQKEIATELSGWRAVAEAQREDLWMLVTETRLGAARDLAQDAAELAERIEKQMPLALETSHGTPALVIRHAEDIAKTARAITFDARNVIQNAGRVDEDGTLTKNAEQLVHQFGELDAALDRLNFEHESDEEVSEYVNSRLLESRTVADQADAWARVARCIEDGRYHGLAEVDQHKIAVATELLRVEMLGIESDLENQFRQQTDEGVPAEIVNMVRRLHRVMETVTLNQAAATFATASNKLEAAERRQAAAVEGFARAEVLFDKIRRAVVDALDEYDPPDPNIADLEDPTLDEFLAQLEREPNIEAQLGIPDRPRNLRVVADTMMWQQQGGEMLGSSAEAAMQRARRAMQKQRNSKAKSKKPRPRRTAEEREQPDRAKQMQEMLEKSLASVKEKADDPDTSPEQRRRLEQMARNMERMLNQGGRRNADAEQWKRIAQSDQAKAVLQALAKGKAIPDQQWNKLLSTLDDGLWQVRGTSPPEEYRKAIQQYQDRLRRLTGSVVDEAEKR